MNIVTLKKSAIAALTIAVVATGSLSASTAPAAAGGKHFGAGFGAGLAIGLIGNRGYRRDRGYHGNTRYYYGRSFSGGAYDDCWNEYRVRRDRYGERYRLKVRVCN